jgi:tetratricopeptide (TPR) repeat protein
LNKYPQGQIPAYGNIGIFFHHTAQYSKALENFFKVNELLAKLDPDSLLLIRNNNLLGEVYRALKEYDQALDYYELARELSESTGEFQTQVITNANIALTHIEQGEFEKALSISENSLEISNNRDFLFGIMISLFNIGLVNHHLEKYTVAIDTFQRLEHMVELYGEQIGAEFNLGKIKLYHSMAESYFAIGQFSHAERYLLSSYWHKLLEDSRCQNSSAEESFFCASHSYGPSP